MSKLKFDVTTPTEVFRLKSELISAKNALASMRNSMFQSTCSTYRPSKSFEDENKCLRLENQVLRQNLEGSNDPSVLSILELREHMLLFYDKERKYLEDFSKKMEVDLTQTCDRIINSAHIETEMLYKDFHRVIQEVKDTPNELQIANEIISKLRSDLLKKENQKGLSFRKMESDLISAIDKAECSTRQSQIDKQRAETAEKLNQNLRTKLNRLELYKKDITTNKQRDLYTNSIGTQTEYDSSIPFFSDFKNTRENNSRSASPALQLIRQKSSSRPSSARLNNQRLATCGMISIEDAGELAAKQVIEQTRDIKNRLDEVELTAAAFEKECELLRQVKRHLENQCSELREQISSNHVNNGILNETSFDRNKVSSTELAEAQATVKILTCQLESANMKLIKFEARVQVLEEQLIDSRNQSPLSASRGIPLPVHNLNFSQANKTNNTLSNNKNESYDDSQVIISSINKNARNPSIIYSDRNNNAIDNNNNIISYSNGAKSPPVTIHSQSPMSDRTLQVFTPTSAMNRYHRGDKLGMFNEKNERHSAAKYLMLGEEDNQIQERQNTLNHNNVSSLGSHDTSEDKNAIMLFSEQQIIPHSTTLKQHQLQNQQKLLPVFSSTLAITNESHNVDSLTYINVSDINHHNETSSSNNTGIGATKNLHKNERIQQMLSERQAMANKLILQQKQPHNQYHLQQTQIQDVAQTPRSRVNQQNIPIIADQNDLLAFLDYNTLQNNNTSNSIVPSPRNPIMSRKPPLPSPRVPSGQKY